MPTIDSILIANRGEIAVRIIKTTRRLGIKSIAIYSDYDKNAPHVLKADIAIPLSGNTLDETYLDIKQIIHIAKTYKADAIHPGYGFLAENSTFAECCSNANIALIGPREKVIRLMGDKTKAREFLMNHGIPCVPGAQNIKHKNDLLRQANKIGYPIILKAALGGGGRGMRIVNSESELLTLYESSKREALKAFSNDNIFVEKYLDPARHIEVQIIADDQGHTLHLGTRDCSIQRRQQKIIEEAPAILKKTVEKKLIAIALDIAKHVGYQNAGTIEFLLDEKDNIYFLEMNTRLQVEHCVTESVTNLDIVELQIKVAKGISLELKQQDINIEGHAIEARICAEDTSADCLPQTGKIVSFTSPTGDKVRIDSGIKEGNTVSNQYDSLLFKLITTGRNRQEALQQLSYALQKTILFGVTTNQEQLLDIVNSIKENNTLPHTSFLSHFNTTTLFNEYKALIFSAILNHQHRVSSAYPNSCKNWHSASSLNALFYFKVNRQLMQVSIDNNNGNYHLNIKEQNYNVKLLYKDQSIIKIKINDEVAKCHFCLADNMIHLFEQGHYLTIENCTHTISHNQPEDSSSNIIAPMDGSVVAINASMGKAIKKGDIVITLESMKMELPLSAKIDGIVETLNVVQGQQVKNNELLMTLVDN